MELRTAVEAAAHDGAERLAVHGDGRRVEAHRGGVAMHEIGRAAVIDALQQRPGIGGSPERVPAHVRHARALYRRHPHHPAGDPPPTKPETAWGWKECGRH